MKLQNPQISKRKSLLSPLGLAATLALATVVSPVVAQDAEGPFTLPPLPYSYDALEPHIDAETMRIHHNKHHRAYVDNSNKLLAGQAEFEGMTPEEIILNLDKAPKEIQIGLLNNVGGHINHSLFWQMMAPDAGGPPTGAIAKAIDETFGSFEDFKKEFNKEAATRFGSGWAWLVLDADGNLAITSTANQDPPVLNGQSPLLGLDVWEHAYYLKYQNRRADYSTEWWNTVNWDFVNQLYSKAKKS